MGCKILDKIYGVPDDIGNSYKLKIDTTNTIGDSHYCNKIALFPGSMSFASVTKVELHICFFFDSL